MHPTTNHRSPREVHEPLDLAIVGGGVSGLYSGWRCAAQGDPGSIAIFECSGRTGGRLLSVQPPGLGGLHLELGGMRFSTAHRHVAGLVEAFGLATRPFHVHDPGNIAYLRGRILRRSDLADPARLPYHIPPEDHRGLEIGFTALATERYLRACMSVDEPEIDLQTVDWERVAKEGVFHGHHVSKIAMQYAFERCVSTEARRFSQDSSGYSSIYKGTATVGFPWVLRDYHHSIRFKSCTDGFCALTRALRDRFLAAGGVIHTESRLVGFDLEPTSGDPPILRLEIERDGAIQTVRARRLVLAMPRRALELLEPRSPMLGPSSPEVHRMIRSVTPRPLFKLVLCYRTRWWEAVGVRRGQSVTDLPLRQAYYWAAPPPNEGGAIMIYNDGADLDYWESLCLQEERYPIPTHHDFDESIDTDERAEWHANPAPRLLVEEAHRQLLEMHGVEDDASIGPYAAAHREWDLDPFGGGSNYWNEGVDTRLVEERMMQPVPGVPVHVCGEAYSHDQGWVEGALEVTERMLQTHLDLEPPSYLGRASTTPDPDA